jgi:hypothetical protein
MNTKTKLYIVMVRDSKYTFTLRVKAKTEEEAITKALASDEAIIEVIRVTCWN